MLGVVPAMRLAGMTGLDLMYANHVLSRKRVSPDRAVDAVVCNVVFVRWADGWDGSTMDSAHVLGDRDTCHVDLAVVVAGVAFLSTHHDHWI